MMGLTLSVPSSAQVLWIHTWNTSSCASLSSLFGSAPWQGVGSLVAGCGFTPWQGAGSVQAGQGVGGFTLATPSGRALVNAAQDNDFR